MKVRSSGRLPDMWKAAYDLVAQVPEGMVTTYGEVAKALGDIAASRFVGLAMSRNEDIVRVPCRRVVQSNGTLGGYTGGLGEKKRMLRREGIRISGDKIVDFQHVLFTDFKTNHPLARLRARQRTLKKRLVIKDQSQAAELVAGIDVAYRNEHAFAAMVTFDLRTRVEVDRAVVEGEVQFPYIPTYLAFREIPVIKPLMELVDDSTVVMYDGNGTLHPEGFGIASQVGVEFNVPTIGVAKKLLCGIVRGTSGRPHHPIVFDGRVVGHAIMTGQMGNPVYVSPGHRISRESAVEIASRFLKHRIPEPTRVAHIVAGAARRGTNNK
jgi:deoxyribonuclease V